MRLRTWLRLHSTLVYAFLYGPIVMLVILSFNRSGLPTAWGGFSLHWYRELLHNEALLNAALNSVLVAAGSTLVSAVFGTLLAMGLERIARSLVLDAFVFLPMIIPDIVLAIALLSFFTLIELPLSLLTITVSHIVFNIAFVAAIVRTRLSYFDNTLEEASLDLGAPPLKTFFNVTLPLILPGVLAGSLLAFTISLDEFVIAFFTAGPSQPTLPILIYSMVRFGVTPDVNALATVVLSVSALLILISQRLGGTEGFF
ncbi:MAG: ABC transporter permease [Anaerolineales bacterium]|nr:ABC transporter permease [Anaerolineales bacterium]MDW8162433.1 ABC transporter permease [Anaerolineales bacterium]